MTSHESLRAEMAFFLAITLALSAVFYVLIIAAGTIGAQGGLLVAGLMWCPGVAAFVTCLIFRRSLRGLGWRWGQTRYQIMAYVMPFVYGGVAYGVIWASGLGGIKGNLPATTPSLILSVILSPLAAAALTLGEETGWRGFLVPRLAELTDFPRTALISGVIWAVWHFPLILFADYGNPAAPAWYSLVCFTLMIVGVGFACAWLRLRSGSLWTAVLLHASHNFYLQHFFGPMTEDTGLTRFIGGEFGIAMAITGTALALLFWRVNSHLPAAQSGS